MRKLLKVVLEFNNRTETLEGEEAGLWQKLVNDACVTSQVYGGRVFPKLNWQVSENGATVPGRVVPSWVRDELKAFLRDAENALKVTDGIPQYKAYWRGAATYLDDFDSHLTYCERASQSAPQSAEGDRLPASKSEAEGENQ